MISREKYVVKQITAKDAYAVRHPVLRTGKPIETCVFSGDALASTIHLGLYHDETLIGVTSFMKTLNNSFKEKYQYQLRGMAVLNDFQGKGLGAILIAKGDALLLNLNTELLWCNAREIAVNFYKRNGFKITGKPFEIPEIGIHYVMYKHL